MHEIRTISHADWAAEGRRLFGDNPVKWRLRCPACGHVTTPEDYQSAGAPDGAVGFSCIGRWSGALREAIGGRGPGPCNYAGGGLIPLHTLEVTLPDGRTRGVFEFAEGSS